MTLDIPPPPLDPFGVGRLDARLAVLESRLAALDALLGSIGRTSRRMWRGILVTLGALTLALLGLIVALALRAGG